MARSISSGITILYRPTGAPDPPHMLRHSTGNKLANDGHDNPGATTHGSPNIMHTVRYTEMAPNRLKNFWEIGK